ncbi:MAG: hypothetical protein NUV57_04215 [archaeon]|nr:hypothetical protein [archaeon]
MQNAIKETIQKLILECQESGASKWEVMKVLKELENFSGTEQQLRKNTAETLEKLNPDAAKTFRSFEKLKVFTSKEKREAFDRGNIIKSLLKETNISRGVAEKIGSEVEDEIKDLKIEYLNTHLIREMVNVKLLGYGHEPIHTQYARLGMPVFEIEKKLEENSDNSPEILREYNWLKIIDQKARSLHFDSLIHIYAPEDFSTKIFCFSDFLDGTKEEIAVNATIIDKQSTVPLTIRAMNFSIFNSTNLKSKNKIGEEIKAIDLIFSLTQKRTIELALFNDFEWQGLAEYKKKATQIANSFLSAKTNSFSPVVTLDTKYKIKLLERKNIKGITLGNNSKERTTHFDFGVVPGNTNGLLQLTGVNLEKVFIASAENETLFYEKLEKISKTIEILSEEKKELLGKRNYIDKKILETISTGVNLAGLFSVSTQLKENNPSKAAENIISFFQKKKFITMQMNEKDSLEKFGITEDFEKTQGILMEMNSRQRKSYGFKYKVSGINEAEELLNDVPSVKIIY